VIAVLPQPAGRPRWFRVAGGPWARLTWHLAGRPPEPRDGDAYVDLDRGPAVFFQGVWHYRA
jgi:hypothetical protein